tara:strand:+ start:1734 stop:1913 length:180 start_codon:yes stop_codon:yes gene_type:complete
MKEQEFNPLEGWTKEQIKSVLKANTKTTLLKTAMTWRIMFENLQIEINKLKEDKNEPTE